METQARLYPSNPDATGFQTPKMYETMLQRPLLFRNWASASKKDVDNWLLAYYHGGLKELFIQIRVELLQIVATPK